MAPVLLQTDTSDSALGSVLLWALAKEWKDLLPWAFHFISPLLPAKRNYDIFSKKYELFDMDMNNGLL